MMVDEKIKEKFKDIDWLNERIFNVNEVWNGIARTKKDKIIGFLNEFHGTGLFKMDNFKKIYASLKSSDEQFLFYLLVTNSIKIDAKVV